MSTFHSSDVLRTQIAELEQCLAKLSGEDAMSLVSKRRTLLMLIAAKEELRRLIENKTVVEIAILRERLADLEAELLKASLPEWHKQRPSPGHHSDLPEDGQTYWIYNPFVELSGIPYHWLIAYGMATAGRLGTYLEFGGSSGSDTGTHWKFIRANNDLFYIRCASCEEHPNPSVIVNTGPYIQRDSQGQSTTGLSIGGSIGDPTCLWRVGTLDGTTYFISHPDFPNSMLFAWFLGNRYWPYCGVPNRLGAGDIRLEKVA